MEAYMDILLKERLVSYYEKHILEDVMPEIYLVSRASAIYIFTAL